MVKYVPLKAALERDGRPSIDLTFNQIEQFEGPLPNSAGQYQAWWANEGPGNHVQARA